MVVSSTSLTLVNVYAPQRECERVELLCQLQLLLSTSAPMMVGGDFNIDVDRFVQDSMQALKRLVQDFLPRDTGVPRSNITWTDAGATRWARITSFCHQILVTWTYHSPGFKVQL